jgi:hypothetical protein
MHIILFYLLYGVEDRDDDGVEKAEDGGEYWFTFCI